MVEGVRLSFETVLFPDLPDLGTLPSYVVFELKLRYHSKKPQPVTLTPAQLIARSQLPLRYPNGAMLSLVISSTTLPGVWIFGGRMGGTCVVSGWKVFVRL